jgi:hypothetical protein
MDYALRREDRAAVLKALETGEYEAIATSSQTALDELAHLAIELGVFEALKLIRVRRDRAGIPDELLLRTLAVLPFVEALGLSAAAGALFQDAAILLQLGYSIEQVQKGFNGRHRKAGAAASKAMTPCHGEVLREELARLDGDSLQAFRQACCQQLFARRLVKGRIYAIDGSGIHDRYRLVGLLNVQEERPLWISWRLLAGQASEKGQEASVVRALLADFDQVAGGASMEWLLMDAYYADGPLLAWLEYERHTHALVRLPEERQLYQDLAGLLRAGLITRRTHTDVRYLSGHKQVRQVSLAAARDLTSWESFVASAQAYGVAQPTLWGLLIHSVDVANPSDVEDWAVASTQPFSSARAGYQRWRQRWQIENNGFRELKEGWHLERAPWSYTDDTVVAARVTFTLIAFNVAQIAKTAHGRQLTHHGIRRLRRELAAHYGPAPVVVFAADAFGIFHIEEIMTLIGLPPQFSLRRPLPGVDPPLS